MFVVRLALPAFLLSSVCLPVRAEQLKVGVILPLTGEMSSIGVEIQRGMELARENSTALKIIYEDDHSFEKSQAVKASKKLLSVDKVDLVFNAAVNTAQATASIYSQHQTPMVVVWDDNRQVDKLGDYVLSMGFSTEGAGEDIARFAHNSLKTRGVAVVSAHDEWSEMIATAFVAEYRKLGGTISQHIRVSDNQHDFRALTLRIKKTKATAIYAPLNPPMVQNLVRQSRQLGFKGSILLADGFGENELRELGADSEGLYLTQLWNNDKRFATQYRKKYGHTASPINLSFAALGYDAIAIASELSNQLAKSDKKNRKQTLFSALKSTSFTGLSGTTKLYRIQGSGKREPILVVKNGAFQLVDEDKQ